MDAHRPPIRFLLGAFVVAALLRIVAIGFTTGLSHDAACFYLPNARALSEGGWGNWEAMTIAVPPLFPYLVSLVGTLVPDLELAALCLSVIASSALVFSSWATARKFFPHSERIPRVAAALAVVQPLAVRLGADARADALYALTFSLSLLVGLSLVTRPGRRTAFLFGGGVGIAYLLRPEALGLVGLLLCAWALELRRRKDRGVFFRRSMIATGCMMLMLAPALAWNMHFVHEKVGHWTLSPKAGLLLDYDKFGIANPLTSLNQRGDMTLHEEKLSDPSSYPEFALGSMLAEHPGAMTRAFFTNVGQFALHLVEALGYVLFPLLLLGCMVGRGLAAPGTLRITLMVIAFFAIAFSIFYVSRRFWLPFVPLLLAWTAAGLVIASERTTPRRWLAIVVFAITILQSFQPHEAHTWSWRASSERILGARIRERYGSGQLCVSSKGKVTWYADGQHLPLPDADLEQTLRYMELRDARLLVLDVERLQRRRPGFLEAIEKNHNLVRVDEQDGLVVWEPRPD